MKITIDFIDESSSRLYTCDAIRNFVGPRSDSWYCDLGGSCSGHLRRVGLFLIVYGCLWLFIIYILESLQKNVKQCSKHLSTLSLGGRMMLFQRMSYDSDSKEPQEIFSIPETGTATPKTWSGAVACSDSNHVSFSTWLFEGPLGALPQPSVEF